MIPQQNQMCARFGKRSGKETSNNQAKIPKGCVMSSTQLSLPLPLAITHATLRDEATVIDQAIATAALSADARKAIEALAAALVGDIRKSDSRGLMDVFLTEYGLSTDDYRRRSVPEGVSS